MKLLNLFFFVIILPLSFHLYAKKIGTNSFGVQLGYSDFSFQINDMEIPIPPNPSDQSITPFSAEGFAFYVDGNYNLFSPEDKNIGIDLPVRYLSSEGDQSITSNGSTTNLDLKFNLLQASVRPYYKLSENYVLFADLGVAHILIDVDANDNDVTDTTDFQKGKKTAFSGGLGIEAKLGTSLTISPMVNFSKAAMISETNTNTVGGTTTTTTSKYSDMDAINFTIPVSYPISDSLDLTITYSYFDAEDSKELVPDETSATEIDYPDVISTSASFIGIGLDYKF
jgi:opacity protein-like surface antigen